MTCALSKPSKETLGRRPTVFSSSRYSASRPACWPRAFSFSLPRAGPGCVRRWPAMVERHNVVRNVAPNNLWRGLLGVEFGVRFARWSLGFQIQHESDHETVDLVRQVPNDAAPAGFLQLNSVGVRADWPPPLSPQRIPASAVARLHVPSCTIDVARCANGAGGWWSRAFEATADLVWSGSAAASPAGSVEPVIAFHADWPLPPRPVSGQDRLLLHAGG